MSCWVPVNRLHTIPKVSIQLPPGDPCLTFPRTCNKCAYATCNSSTSSGGGVNPGVIAGPIIGVVLLLASLGLFWWLRRKKVRPHTHTHVSPYMRARDTLTDNPSNAT